MNDEINGQLTQNWSMPPYMQTLLWLEGDGGTASTEGKNGLFTLPAPCPLLTLRWGNEQGSALIQLPWQSDSLDWDGSVRIGGYVDALHSGGIPQMDKSIMLVYVGGQPMSFRMNPYLGVQQRTAIPYTTPDFHQGVAMDVGQSVTTWIVEEGSPLVSRVNDALIHNLRVHLMGRFAEAGSGWDQYFAMPILLEGVTLFGP